MRSLILSLLVLWIALPVLADEPHPLAVQALAALDAFDEDAWTFTRTTTGTEGNRIERHDATQPEAVRWTLLEVDGRKPAKSEIEKFRRERAEIRAGRKKGSEDDQDVDHRSIRLLSETPDRATFSFRPKRGGGIEGRFAEHVVGTLVVNKDGAWAERFELRNDSGMSPIPGVKVSRFRLTLTFQRIAESGHVVPASIELTLRGRAFMVKSLDQDRSTRYSGFVRARSDIIVPLDSREAALLTT